MNREPKRNPVTAISEAEATGETAEIFADIRETMQLPLITSIWRVIADIEGGLRAAWDAAKPLYITGQPEAALQKILAQSSLPILEPIVSGQLACANVTNEDLLKIRSIVDAYNRSNGMVLLASTALICAPSGTPANEPLPQPLGAWPTLPTLMERSEIDDATWEILQHINSLGLTAPRGGAIATIWRHLAQWPGLLAVFHAAFAPLHRDGTIQRSAQEVHSASLVEGARIAYLRPEHIEMPDPAREIITRYATSPESVANILTRGHILAQWLQTGDSTG